MDQTLLAATFRKVILANELSNNLAAALRFSLAPGGKSGYSFGVCQLDVSNNPAAAACLRACGFTLEEIEDLKAKTADVRALDPKLVAGAATIELFDDIQLNSCITRSQAILANFKITPADDTALLAIADYNNQYYLSAVNKPGYLVNYLVNLRRPFTALDVLNFKLNDTPYGKSHPEDCKRRYDNLLKVVAAA